MAAPPQEGRVVAITEEGVARWSNGSPSGVSAEWGHKEWPKAQWAMTDIDAAAGTVECECDGTRLLVAFGGYAHTRRPCTAQGRPTWLVTLPRPQEWGVS